MGKIGAFVGTWIFPAIQRRYASKTNPDLELQVPFYLSSGLCIFSALLTFFLCLMLDKMPLIEIKEFVEYLRKNGFDVSKLGKTAVLLMLMLLKILIQLKKLVKLSKLVKISLNTKVVLFSFLIGTL